jgi:predicted RNA-binding Zn ribbon-like protein
MEARMILLNRPLELLIIRISAALLFTIAVQTQIYSQQLQSAQPQGLVKLNVIVTDSSNQLVSDIKQEEFRVSDNNQPQSISFFQKNRLRLPMAL